MITQASHCLSCALEVNIGVNPSLGPPSFVQEKIEVVVTTWNYILELGLVIHSINQQIFTEDLLCTR